MTWLGIQPLRFGFVADQADDASTSQHRSRNKRRMAMLHRAAEVLQCLPEPGESLHAIMTGEYDLVSMLVYLVDSRSCPVAEMRIATLSFNGRCLAEMLRFLDSGRVKRLSMLASHYLSQVEKPLWEETLTEFHSRGMRDAGRRPTLPCQSRYNGLRGRHKAEPGRQRQSPDVQEPGAIPAHERRPTA